MRAIFVTNEEPVLDLDDAHHVFFLQLVLWATWRVLDLLHDRVSLQLLNSKRKLHKNECRKANDLLFRFACWDSFELLASLLQEVSAAQVLGFVRLRMQSGTCGALGSARSCRTSWAGTQAVCCLVLWLSCSRPTFLNLRIIYNDRSYYI